MDTEGFIRPGTEGRTAIVLRNVNRCGEKFSTELNSFTMMDEYLGILRGKKPGFLIDTKLSSARLMPSVRSGSGSISIGYGALPL